MRLALAFVFALLSLLACDFAWLGATLNGLYRPAMGSLMSDQVNFTAAAGFYGLYAFGLAWLIVLPAVASDASVNRLSLTLRAGLLGLVAFGTYDLTGLSVIRGWPLTLSLIDMAWGAVTTAIAANISALGLKLLGQSR